MTLKRVWIPSPNYSTGQQPLRLLVVHTAEGATNFTDLGHFFANPDVEVSSHVGIDDQPGVIGEYVHSEHVAWTAGSVNGYSDQVELCAFAAWSRDEWLRHPVMLDNLKQWLAEESDTYGIPLVRSTERGVCGHVDVSGPGGHTDPGPDFPWDIILGGAAPAPLPPPPAAAGAAPPWPGRYLAYPPVMQGTDVHTWQAQMATRGWTIAVDGQYGPESASVCEQFQAEKGLAVDGVVGPDTWAAAWAAPVT